MTAKQHVHVRLFRPEDTLAVQELVRNGQLGLVTQAVKDAYRLTWVVPGATVALAAAAAGVAVALRASSLNTAGAALLGAATAPLALWVFARHGFGAYVQKHMVKGDLDKIPTVYSEASAGPGSGFWVAELASAASSSIGSAAATSPAQPAAQAPRVVGCVGLQRCFIGDRSHAIAAAVPEEAFELRRMAVDVGCRRQGIAAALLRVVIDHARKAEPRMKRIQLTTSSAQYPAHQLYERGGWVQTNEVWEESGLLKLRQYVYEL